MAQLVAILYPDEATAVKAVNMLRALQQQYLIELEDVVYVTKDPNNKVQLHQSVNLTAAGTLNGAFWGMLIGLIFFIPVAGLVIGAVMGALSGKLTDYGIDDNFIKQVSTKLEPGKAAVFMMIRHVTADKVVPELATLGGEVFTSNIGADAEARLNAALASQGNAQAEVAAASQSLDANQEAPGEEVHPAAPAAAPAEPTTPTA